MKFNIILFIGLLFFNDVSGQVVRLSCVDTPLQADLDLERVAGDWHEISRTPNPWEGGDCTQITQVAVNNGTALKMRWEEIVRSEESNDYRYALSVGRPAVEEVAASMDVRFQIPEQQFSQPFRVVYTDYNNSMVLYSCYPYYEIIIPGFIFYTENVWILSRKRTLDDETIFRLREQLDEVGVFEEWLEQVNQRGCDDVYQNVENRFTIDESEETPEGSVY